MGNMGQCTHSKLDRLHIVSVGSLRDRNLRRSIIGEEAQSSSQAVSRVSNLWSRHKNTIEVAIIFQEHAYRESQGLCVCVSEFASNVALVFYSQVTDRFKKLDKYGRFLSL